MPTLEEVHLGIGSGECTFDYDSELIDEALPYRHLVYYRDGKPFGTFVILARTPSLEGITLSGYGLGFWEGVDKDGPVIERREYIAGNNQLDNGDFEILDALGFALWWSKSEGSFWASTSADSHSGTRAVHVNADKGKDDVLISEPRNITEGALVSASGWAKRLSGSIGRLRLRTVYEGRYDPPDLLAGISYGSWTNHSDTPGDISGVTDDEMILGPCTQVQYIADPSFESGFSEWTGNTALDPDSQPRWSSIATLSTSYGTLNPRTGSLMMEAFSSGAIDSPDRWLGPTSGPGVSPGERYRLSGYVVERSLTKGSAMLLLQPLGLATSDNVQSPPLVASYFQGTSPPAFALEWRQLQVEYDVPEGVSALQPNIYVNFEVQTDGHLYGSGFVFDDVTLTRIKGNVAKITSPEIDVIPERTYKLLVPLTGSWPDSGATHNGTIHAYVALKGTGRTDQAIVSSPIDVSQSDTQTVLSVDVTPPSGYDVVQVTLVGTDLLGGNVIVGRATLVDNDTSTSVSDEVIGPSGAAWAKYTQASVAPAGTQKVHLELVAEANGDGWAADDVEWHRTEATTGIAAIIDALLRDPDTGEYLVSPGTIYPTGTPAYDWLIVNETNREALLELLRGGRVLPALEFRHNPDNTLDVGTADQVFAHITAFAFVGEDLLLLSLPEVQASVEDRLSRVKVIGAAVQRKAPLPDAVVTGDYETTIPDAYDWFGNPVRRTRLVEDSAVNFAAFADARAQDQVEKSADVGQTISVEISDWHAWGDFDCGDFLPVYKPEALLQDLTNPMTYRGARVYPVEKRCLSRKLDMARGDGFEVKIRRPDGTLYDVDPNIVRWSDRTRATLELGDQRLDFANDPQGPAAGLAFLKFRAAQAS